MSVRSFQFDANDYLFQLIQFYFKLDIKGTEDIETVGKERKKVRDRNLERTKDIYCSREIYAEEVEMGDEPMMINNLRTKEN